MDQPKGRKSTYLPTPKVPPQLRERYQAILLVLSGQWTVSEAARHLSLSRNHFQTLMHKALTGFIQGLKPKPPGRPARPSSEKRLQNDTQKMTRENRRLKSRVETIDRLLSVASDLLKNGAQPSKSQRRRREPTSRKRAAAKGDDDDLRERLGEAETMKREGLSHALAARVAGMSPSTLRRLLGRSSAGVPLRLPRQGPASPDARRQVVELVRRLHGLPGAASLAHAVPGVSRRQAAALKSETLTLIEKERKLACRQIHVTQPGVIRGFDQLVLPTPLGHHFALISADASVPFRTSFLLTQRYDAESVAKAVEDDFTRNGAPLIWRADRAHAHDAPAVRRVLERFDVIVLHGPPHHPGYYGQLERQNREHRAWLGRKVFDPASIAQELARMLDVLNKEWSRPTLRWMTAEQLWNRRSRLAVDRRSFRADVLRRAAHLRRRLPVHGGSVDLAERLAIEQALFHRGLLAR